MAIFTKKTFYEMVKLIFSYFRLSTRSDPDRKPSTVSKKSTAVTIDSDWDVLEAVLGKTLQITIHDFSDEVIAIHGVMAWIYEKNCKELMWVRVIPLIRKEKTVHCVGTIIFTDTDDNVVCTCHHHPEKGLVEVFGATGTRFGYILRKSFATKARILQLPGITKKPIKAGFAEDFHLEYDRRSGRNGDGVAMKIRFSPSLDAISKIMRIATVYFMNVSTTARRSSRAASSPSSKECCFERLLCTIYFVCYPLVIVCTWIWMIILLGAFDVGVDRQTTHQGYLEGNETMESVKGLEQVLE